MRTISRPFHTCWERINRAYVHSIAFADEWNGLINGDNGYEIRVTMNDDGTGSLWVDLLFGELPAALSIKFGEILYQLRAALDACVYQAAILETGKNPPPNENALEFPICPSAEKFAKARWKLRPLTNQYRLDFIEMVQPYNAPAVPDEIRVFNLHRALGILNDWARIDRHRRLHIVGSWASNAEPKFRVPEGTHLAWFMVTYDGFLEHDCEIAAFKIEGWERGMKMEANPDVFIDVAVDEPPTPCADTDTLYNRTRAMAVAVQTVVSSMEKSFGLVPGEPVWG